MNDNIPAAALDAVHGSIRMDKATALRIQADQVEWYVRLYGPQIRQQVADATTAHQLEDGVFYSIAKINRHIPRGGFIESLNPARQGAHR